MTLKLILKYLLSAGVITLVSEVVRRNDRMTGFSAEISFASSSVTGQIKTSHLEEVRRS